MKIKNISRRKAIETMATGGAGLALTGLTRVNAASADEGHGVISSSPQTTAMANAFRGQHQPKPLPFDAAKLKGLSEKLIKSHWENNYSGAVKALNAVEQRLDAMMKDKDL